MRAVFIYFSLGAYGYFSKNLRHLIALILLVETTLFHEQHWRFGKLQ